MRRRLFLGLGGGFVALGAIAYWRRNALARNLLSSRQNARTPTMAAVAGEDVCVLMPEQTAGPYYIKSELRSSIVEDRRGLPLTLQVELVKSPDCRPIEGASVEVWHCDAAGAYSGYSGDLARAPFDTMMAVAAAGGPDARIEPTDTTTYLRGAQISDARGQVRFITIFPGWYDPRVTHIHLKVSRDGQSYLTTQLYFPDEICRDIYSSHPSYVAHGLCPYNLSNDLVLSDLAGGTGVVLQPERKADDVFASVRVGMA